MNDQLTITQEKLEQALELAAEEGYCCHKSSHRAESIWWWLDATQDIGPEDPMPGFMLYRLGRE